MNREVQSFREGLRRSGRCFVRVGYCVSLLVVNLECGGVVVRAYRWVNDDVAIESSEKNLLSTREYECGEVLRTRRLLCFVSFC